MNEEKTLAPDAWQTLCQQQHARALAGDQQAAKWCAQHAPVSDSEVKPATDLEQLTPTERVKLSNVLQLRDADLAHFPMGHGQWPKVIDFCQKLVTGAATPKDVRVFARAVANIGGLETYASTAGQVPEFCDLSRNAEESAKLQSILDGLKP